MKIDQIERTFSIAGREGAKKSNSSKSKSWASLGFKSFEEGFWSCSFNCLRFSIEGEEGYSYEDVMQMYLLFMGLRGVVAGFLPTKF